MKTGFIIIHYNDYDSLVHLIDNIKDYSVLDKIIIYDNNSNPSIQKKIKDFKNAKIDVIFSNKNNGYSYAINEASKYLIKEFGKCNIIVSNTDIMIDCEDSINELISLLSKREVGLVVPTVIENGKLNRGWKEISPKLDSLLNVVWIHKFFRNKKVYYKDSYYDSEYSYVDVASGCFFLIKSKTLQNINFLDENVFLYYEENILAKKLHNIGLNILVSNEVFIIHNHSISIDKNMKKIAKLKKQKESQYYFHKKYNNANKMELFLLKSTALVNRQILKVIYWMKDRKNRK